MKPNALFVVALGLIVIAGGIVLLNRKKDEGPTPVSMRSEVMITRDSSHGGAFFPAERPVRDRASSPEEGLTEMNALAVAEGDRMMEQWIKQASVSFGQTKRHLVEDLGLTDAQAGELGKVFARREEELESLLTRMASDEADDGRAIVQKVCDLIRNKGLREDLSGILSQDQLEAFDAREAKRERETVEARAYRDLAEINAVVQLADSQKQDVLGALVEQAPEKVADEAAARAFMSLTYGPLATDMDSTHVRALAHMMNEALPTGSPSPDIESEEYWQRAGAQKAERIENELTILRDVLDDDQLDRYRKHLEAESPW